MRKLQAFISLLLLLTSPTMLIYPQEPKEFVPRIPFPARYEKNRPAPDYIWSYDDVLQFLDALETGELEDTCTEEELDEIVHFLAFLAKAGALPGSEESLDLEIQALLNGEDVEEDLYEETLSSINDTPYMRIPFLLDNREVTLCKHHTFKCARKWAKKHKKGLLIGTAIVVAAVVVVVAVAATTAAAGAVATSAASTAKSLASAHKSEPKEQQDNACSPPTNSSSEIPPLAMRLFSLPPSIHAFPLLKSPSWKINFSKTPQESPYF